MLKNQFKFTLRNLRRNMSYTLINVSGLAVGMTVCLLITLWVQDERSYDRFHEQADYLYRVGFKAQDYFGAYQPGPLAQALKDEYPEIVGASNFYPQFQRKLSVKEHGVYAQGGFVDADFFQMFSFDLLDGDHTTALTNPNSIALTRETAEKLYGHGEVVGENLWLDDATPLTVTAVMENVPRQSHLQFDFIIPTSSNLAPSYLQRWDVKSTHAYVLLHEDALFEAVDRKVAGVMDRYNPEWGNTLFLEPITKIHLYAPQGGGRITYVHLFSVMAVVILLIACINFMNLSTARATKRYREIGIRKTLGSTRRQLIVQFMGESVLLSFLGVPIALMMAELLLPSVNALVDKQMAIAYSSEIVLGLVLLALFTGLVAGSYPALYLSGLRPIAILKGSSASLSARGRAWFARRLSLRSTLVVAQFALSILFIVGVLVIFNQFEFIRNKALGFDRAHVVLLRTQGELSKKSDILKDALLIHPTITSVAMAEGSLEQISGSGSFEWEGRDTDEVIEIAYKGVGYDFLETLRLELAAGRFFSEEHVSDADEAFVINEAAARVMGVENPLGLRMTTHWGRSGLIVGIVKDFHTESLHDEIAPLALTPVDRASRLFVRIAPGEVASTLRFIEETVQAVSPSDPMEYSFLDEEIKRLYANDQRTGRLVLGMALLALFISCLGLLGLAAFAAEQRTKEIGVRKVFGASVMGIIGLLSRDYIRWVLIAFVLATPVAYLAVGRWLENFAYRIDLGPGVFLLAGALALGIALLTVITQAVRTARAKPVEVLRYE